MTLLLLLKRGRVDGESKPGNNLSRSYKHLPAAHCRINPLVSNVNRHRVGAAKDNILVANYETNQKGTINTPCFLSFHLIFLLLKLQFWFQKLHICLEVGQKQQSNLVGDKSCQLIFHQNLKQVKIEQDLPRWAPMQISLEQHRNVVSVIYEDQEMHGSTSLLTGFGGCDTHDRTYNKNHFE